MTGIGVISLAGVVVNNAIVLIDYYNQQLAKGMASYDALMRGRCGALSPGDADRHHHHFRAAAHGHRNQL